MQFISSFLSRIRLAPQDRIFLIPLGHRIPAKFSVKQLTIAGSYFSNQWSYLIYWVSFSSFAGTFLNEFSCNFSWEFLPPVSVQLLLLRSFQSLFAFVYWLQGATDSSLQPQALSGLQVTCLVSNWRLVMQGCKGIKFVVLLFVVLLLIAVRSEGFLVELPKRRLNQMAIMIRYS